MNIAAEQAHVRKNLGEYARGAESDCARAMAEAKRVLRELSLVAHFEAHDRSTQPIAELLKAEESSEAAMGMINDQ
jgi:hypothetical protein